MTALRLAAVSLGLLWWAPTIALALLDLSTFYMRARLALWAVRVLREVGEVDAADRLLKRSRAAVERHGKAYSTGS